MNGWLESYAFRIHIGVDLFLIAILGTVLLAWLTVGHRAFKAATSNPVETLRYE
jgi:ABC-type lipoprotein release transport system permease subunit